MVIQVKAQTYIQNPTQAQAGASLIETMLGMALGLFLMLGCIQIYLAVQKTFNLQIAVAALQENGRFATHFLQEQIRMAGYANCDGNDHLVNTDLAIRGYQNALPDFLQGKVVKDTDSVVIGRCTMQ